VIKFGMRSPKIRRYAVIIAMALMLVSVVVLADVIYYYQGVITAQVTKPPLEFYSGKNFKYKGEKFPLNSQVENYANFTATPTGFIAKINITNAYYVYFYHALGLVVNTRGLLYVTNVTVTRDHPIIQQLSIYIQDAKTNQTVCKLTVIDDSRPISGTQSCPSPLQPGSYFISVIVKPNTISTLDSSGRSGHHSSLSLSETVTLYFGYNVASQTSVPLPPISG
jgi:hypothetical protein